jgi:hypothetical protein
MKRLIKHPYKCCTIYRNTCQRWGDTLEILQMKVMDEGPSAKSTTDNEAVTTKALVISSIAI